MRKVIVIAGIATIALLAGTVAGMATGSPAADAPKLTDDELLDVEPYTSSIVEAEWTDALESVEDRVVNWYESNKLADLPDAELEDALPKLTAAISDPSIKEEPERLFYIYEIGFRREAVCRSLPPKHWARAGEYCSATSAPGFEGVPWAAD